MAADVNFDHVLIVVQNLERSIGFYGLLGFKHVETIQRPDDRVAVMRLGEAKIELMHLREGLETSRPLRRITDIGFRHLGFRVDDVEAAYERLKDRIRFDSPPIPIAGRPGRLTVFFKDPDGTELHLVQE
ncbi:MAG TPA: VOC family protein [Candidatus Desulfaltia sp.]|nr:VOC family protein [Candidatus Desulfaltia sp.]